MKTTLRIDGGKELAAALAQLSTRLSAKVQRDALKAGAVPMQARAESTVARAPGAPDIASHIVVATARSKDPQEAVVAVGPSKAERSDQEGRSFDLQGFFLEYGTANMAAQPFMRQAFGEAQTSIKIVVANLWSALVKRGFSTRGSSSGGGLQ